MKKVFLALAILLVAVPAWSAPFLICDPQTGVVGYTLAGLTEVSVAAQTDGSLKYDLTALGNGTYNVQVAACNVWGCSVASPFAFVKQSPTAPAGVRLLAK